jgi:hypothetical protein
MNPIEQTLASHLAYLKLHYLKEHFQALADQAAREQWSALKYLARLIEGEAHEADAHWLTHGATHRSFLAVVRRYPCASAS